MSVQNISTSAGFWEVGAYKANVKRIKDGLDQLDDFTRMIKERSEIELKYGRALQSWNQKWSAHVDKSLPTGSIKTCWTNVLNEGQELAKVHLDVKDRLNDEITKTVALFKKENHHPSAFRAPKEMRDVEEAFEKAQRQWKKMYEKVESHRKAYHNACRNEKSAYVQLVNSQADTSLSVDASDKLRERHENLKKEVNKTKQSYEAYLKEIGTYNNVYVENMTFVFEKCQQTELKRMKFVVEMIGGMQKVLVDLIDSSRLSSVHQNLQRLFSEMGEKAFSADLTEWSQTFGVEAPTKWPEFEEYTPEIRSIGSRKGSQKDTGGVVLMRQRLRSEDGDVLVIKGAASCDDILRESNGASASDASALKRFSAVGDYSSETPSKSRNQRHTPTNPLADPFPMPTPERSTSAAINVPSNRENQSGPPSVANTDSSDSLKYGEFSSRGQGKVLYDYTPVEEDEIKLEKGETIEVLSEPDQLGWCYGRRSDGQTGLFPASYVQAS
uniref:SH3 domain-containing protein n=1 Tax=Steinernema glaseri TaxID=37863 RepID=A0A1I7ZNT0_9BILA